ncbi:STT3 domain-containing protein [Halorussus sp. MSC15.2]|uniref:STT3 domain-containing protein n=1 Tax=Halorussus sp. MSC15.2 TaxID=2283638 RepID=UPI0013D578B9|nr:STT3 domain-containing protein [Halorussus sp. MSC15.2]NEU55661.1 hypothetical protein [Halorussus sp. MSC15.2]
MTDVREAADDLLAEKPDLEPDLRDLLAVDERADGWTFDDVPLDSGTFGELVSRDIVAKDGDEYEIADPPAVRASLDGETTNAESDVGDGPTLPSVSLPSVSRVEAGAFGAALAFVVLLRTYVFPSVFRGDYVVLPSNDPYYYRYWVEQLSAEATGVFDFSVLSGLPGAVGKGEPLMVGALWWLTNLFGGADAAGWVLAWYPVVSSVVVATLAYAMAVRVTDDRRVGLAAVVLLATIPAFAYRTGLGFADHHAFDYPWLVLTALSLVWLADVDREDLSDTRTWLVAGVLGVAVAGQVLAWEAGPLLVGALGVYVASRAAVDVRADQSPLVASAPILGGLALASLLSHLAHTGFGWHTDIVAYSPVLLLVGVLAVSLLGEGVRRADMPAFVFGTGVVAGGLAGLVILQTVLPAYGSKLIEQVDYLLFKSGPAETQSIFAGGPSGFLVGPILELGFAWLLAVPMLVLASLRAYRQRHRPWLVVCTYGWYFLALATLQRRFVGELAPFAAVLAGYAFVAFVAKLDLTTPPTFGGKANKRGQTEPTSSLELPDRSTITAVAVLLLFVTSAGAAQTAVRHEQVKIADDKFRSSVSMNEYAEQRGQEYPENYVLTKWGRNRVYNYFVNGQSRSYGFALQHYESFLAAKNPVAQYEKLRERVGFVVTTDLDLNRIPKDSNYARLHQRHGSAGGGASGAGHYRMMHVSGDGSVKAFALVPGANLTGTASANGTVSVSNTVEVDGTKFVYRRNAEVGPDGTFSVTVSYPGTYRIGNQTVTVSESAVENGGNVSVGA